MAADDTLHARVASLTREVDALGAQLNRLVESADYEDLEHALLAVRIIEHVLEEVAEHGGLGGEVVRTPDTALHRRAVDLADRLQLLRAEADGLMAEHPDEDLEIAITALEIARGSLDEVTERYEPVT